MGTVKIDTGYKARLLPRSLKANDELIDVEQARFKMELLQEECLVLKVRLDTVQQEKVSDLATYKQMLDQVRKTFQDACK